MYTIRHSRIRNIESGIKTLSVSKFMAQPITPPREIKLSQKIGDLLSAVCERHSALPDQVLGKNRSENVVDARQEFVCRLFFIHHYTPGDIGRLLNMDITSIKHLLGLRKASRHSHELLRKWYS